MKLKKEDDINLMRECCIVREIEYTQKGNEVMAEKFKDLRETIENSREFSHESLALQYSDDAFAVQDFLKQMQTFKKSTINRTYYNRAVMAAQRYYKSDETIDKRDFDTKIRNQFFNKNRIRNLRVRLNRRNVKFAGTAITALLAAGTLAMTHPSGKDVGIDPTPPIESTVTPNSTQKPVTGIEHLNINDENFYDKIVQDFKSLYANEHNHSHDDTLSTDYFTVRPEHQDYIYQVKIGDEYRYVSHGNHPNNLNRYLEENDLQSEVIDDCETMSVYSPVKSYDQFGELNHVKIDSMVRIKNPKTGNLEFVKLYDGNNPSTDGLLASEPKSSLLASLGEVAYTLTYSTNTEKDRKALKSEYIEKLNEYQSSKQSQQLTDCSLENQIDEQLNSQSNEQNEIEDRER